MELEECCRGLESTKVTDRSKSIKRIMILLQNEKILGKINNSETCNWNNIIFSTYVCVLQDAEKYVEDLKKRNSSTVSCMQNGQTFFDVISTAMKECDELDFTKIFSYVKKFLEQKTMKECYGKSCLTSLRDSILHSARFRSHMEDSNWTELLSLLKGLCNSSQLLEEYNYVQVECLVLLVRWGPQYRLLPSILREEFAFFTQLCMNISQNSLRSYREAVLRIAHHFCLYTAKDNPMACCKFGETVAAHFVQFYELTTREDKLKIQLIDFFLLLVVLHNPQGVRERHLGAYANNPGEWKRFLYSIFRLMTNDISLNLKCRNKNTTLFTSCGDHQELYGNFVCLFVEVARQLFNNADIDVSVASTSRDDSDIKRQKADLSIMHLIVNLSESKKWPWIQITYSFIKAYPDMMDENDYVGLLTILSNLQKEIYDDQELRYHLYKCFLVLEDIQSFICMAECNIADSRRLWNLIGEATLKEVGLNMCCAETENLLQRLLTKSDMFQSQSVLEIFSSFTKFTKNRIKTLYVYGQNFSFPKSENSSQKTNLLKSILQCLNLEQLDYVSYDLTAKVLTGLILKSWPFHNDEVYKIEKLECPYSDIAEIYLKTSFEDTLILKEQSSEEVKVEVTSIDVQSKNLLLNILDNHIASCRISDESSLELVLNLAIFFKNLLEQLNKYNILSEQEIVKLSTHLKNVMDHFFKNFCTFSVKYTEAVMKKNTHLLEKFCRYISAIDSSFLFEVVVLQVPTEFLKYLFEILGDHNTCSNRKFSNKDIKFQMAQNVMKTLSKYCFISYGNILTQTQLHAFEAIVTHEFNTILDYEYKLVKVFLSEFKKSIPGCLDDKSLQNFLNFLHNVCKARYHLHDSALEIISVLKVILSHLSVVKSNSCIAFLKDNILVNFYDRRSNYGPKVSVDIIKCIEMLIKLDENFGFTKWANDNEELIMCICNFLCNDFQEVRFQAIKSINGFFSVKHTDLDLYNKQKIVFKRIFQLNLQVFEIQGNISEERRIDETVSRSGSVLQSFASLVMCSSIWSQESLFSLLRIAHMKKLTSVEKVMGLIIGTTKNEKLLESSLEYLLDRWLSCGLNLDAFPFNLYNCKTKFEFCLMFYDKVVPYLIENDRATLNAVVESVDGIMLKDLLRDFCPKLLCNNLFKEDATLQTLLVNNYTLKYVIENLGLELFRQIISDNIEKVLLFSLLMILDENDFKHTFNKAVIFAPPSKNITKHQFKEALTYLEVDICNVPRLIAYLIASKPNKIHKLILELKLTLEKEQNGKLRIFHAFYILIDLVIKHMKPNLAFHEFFIRDIVIYLLNLVENFSVDLELSLISAKGLCMFLHQILPQFHACLQGIFHIMVNKLNNMVLHCVAVDDICIDILKIVIIENREKFISLIETLDPFPSHHKFEELIVVYNSIRYKDQNTSLEKDIHYFLQCGYQTKLSDMREEGLKQLNKQLSTKKVELRDLYLKLKKVRGFSEDCKESLLHQLICMLLKLSCSTHLSIALEACKCLGEIGPSNLSTLILQPEKPFRSPNLSPSEVFCGHVISRLLLYITNTNIKLVTASSEGLVQTLSSKEGKKVSKSSVDFGFGEINNKYLIPFLSYGKQKDGNHVRINEDIFISKLSDEFLWAPREKLSHAQWITKLICCILETFSDKSFMKNLIQVCELKVEFCEEILPYLLYLIISMIKKQLKELLFGKIKHFFAQHWLKSVEESYRDSDMIVLNRSSVRCMLDCIHYMRLQKNDELTPRNTVIESLDLNYLHLAQAAHFCQHHFTAVLYTEIWCQLEFDSLNVGSSHQSTSPRMLDIIYERVDENIRRAIENILRGSYKTLGESDALSGCGTSILLDPLRRVEHYKELGRWDQVVLQYEIEISNNKESHDELNDSLKHCGLYKLPLLCNQSDELQYECLWRLSQWNIDQLNKKNSYEFKTSEHFEKYRYFALKSLHDKDDVCFNDTIKKARISEIEKIKRTSLESCKNIYDILARLQSLREMENFKSKNNMDNIIDLLKAWKLQDSIVSNEFCYMEPIKQQRIVLLKDATIRSEYCTNILPGLMLDLADYARKEGYLNVASRALGNIHFIENLSTSIKSKVQFEDAQLCWVLNDKISAHHILRQLYSLKETDCRIKSSALKLAGKWFIESLSENKHSIITDYLLESMKVYQTVERTPEDDANIIDTYDQLGRFTDKEYQQIMAHMNSEVFQQKTNNMKKAKQTALNLKSTCGRRKLTSDENRAIRIHEQQSLIDQTEIENTEKEKTFFLKSALKNYLVNLAMSDVNNIRIFRVFSLFLENKNSSSIADIIEKYLSKIPSCKYIPILPQMVPHLSNTSDNIFTEKVNGIIKRCAEDHPHHTLPLILNLANSNKDREVTKSTTVTSNNDSRISAASDLLRQLKGNKQLTAIISKMEYLSTALIQLAYYKPDTNKEKVVSIPETLSIRKVKNYSNVLLPTVNLPVSKDCSYNNIVGIYSFADKYQRVGGINDPKRVTCTGTDGKARSQLVKGNDDLRQDAVMQQVFNIINSLLLISKTTKNLIIRTYKIVPLSMRSGILEWVDGSMPLGLYLVGENKEPGAHVIFRPRDKRPEECRNMIKNVAGSSATRKLDVFNSICKDFKPVFHKFFEYTFPHPSVWYERKRAYTYSVATSSMCGYILGLGDRHVQNILIDKSTAEVVHIDFGIAFEQGRVLPTPETVPFRLTRDIVDGMGVLGVEGIFRKSCEKTMEVMRQNSQTILTILEVLLYDPLYAWTVTSAEANKRQTDGLDETDGGLDGSPSENNTNITAERALLRLKSKLLGTENGYPVSLEHQVATLIQQAQDPANLCKLFHGWQAYL